MISFKQICSRCKKNYVLATHRDRYPICFECQKGDMLGEITDPKMKKFFDIPEEFYRQNMFLRNIKINYLRYGRLSEAQISAFSKTVEKLNSVNEKPKETNEKLKKPSKTK